MKNTNPLEAVGLFTAAQSMQTLKRMDPEDSRRRVIQVQVFRMLTLLQQNKALRERIELNKIIMEMMIRKRLPPRTAAGVFTNAGEDEK